MKHSKLHGSGMMGGSEKDSGKKTYKGEAYMNDVDEPKHQKIDHKSMRPDAQLGMMVDCSDYKREASGQAYGQGGEDGCRRDEKKIRAQFRPAYSDDTGY